MKRLWYFIPTLLMAGLLGMPVMAADTDTAALDIDIDSIFYVDVGGTAADWTHTVTAEDLISGFIQSDILFDVLDIAGNETYEVTAQMSSPTWDPEVELGIRVMSAGFFTMLNHVTAVVLDGLDSESAGMQSDHDILWQLGLVTWQNTTAADDWTNTITFTCQANTI